MDKKEIVPAAIVAVSFLAALTLYPSLPEKVPSHWNAAGEADGYLSRFWGASFLPLVISGVWLLTWGIPKIAVFKKNISAFGNYYYRFRILLLSFLTYIYFLTLGANFFDFSMNTFLVPGLSLLFLFMSPLLKNAKRNFFIGIRTPWTLSSDRVWRKTHNLGARTIKWVALILLGAAAYPKLFLWFTLAPILAWAFGLVLYSYLEFRKDNQCKDNQFQ